MCVRRLAGGLIAAVLAAGGVSACSDDTTSCDDLRRELADAEAARDESDVAWSDIQAMQDEVAHVLELRDEIQRRCD